MANDALIWIACAGQLCYTPPVYVFLLLLLLLLYSLQFSPLCFFLFLRCVAVNVCIAILGGLLL